MRTAIKTRITVTAAIFMLMITACKTNENNYRTAYEAARQHQQGDIDATTYSLIKQEAMPTAMAIGQDTLRVKTETVALYTDNSTDSGQKLNPFNVVTGQFRQVFNAKAMRERLKNHGYDAYIIETGEPLYYVVAGGCATKEEVPAIVKRVENDKNIVVKLPFPWVLHPAGFPQ